LLSASESLDPVLARVKEMSTFSDQAIVAEAKRSFSIERLDLLSLFNMGSFVSTKINHVYWEQLTVMGYDSAGLLSIRDVRRSDWFSRSRVDGLLIKALRKQQDWAVKAGHKAGCFSTKHFALGVNFGNGDHPAFDYLSIPINPIHKGAAIGSLSFMQGIFPADGYRLADGAAAKDLIWRKQCDEFFDCVIETSDAIVFIVPTHLRTIYIRQWRGQTMTIVIPAMYVHELWPSVLADVTGKLSTLFSQARRVSILIQAGLMPVPLGVLVDMLRATYVDSEIRFFDMGQVLDVATYPENPVGTWVQQPWIKEILADTKRFPISLHA